MRKKEEEEEKRSRRRRKFRGERGESEEERIKNKGRGLQCTGFYIVIIHENNTGHLPARVHSSLVSVPSRNWSWSLSYAVF